ncbi:MAG TPA: RsmB/NOP family class I SAM-dependent RNA methyltransferase, partial [Candidatus Krumholzibacteriaceae bacterium]|nr:RsmB/NOP family class I SAM-dependent RNA methyltransferase [Candidatus Krumholzibacteriaceae bacterium]
MLRDAWALAIEALSWMELSGLSESAALNKTAKQLGIVDMGVKGLAQRLVFETVRRKNYLDSLVNLALKPHSLSDFDLGVQAFLRLYAYKTRIERKGNAYREAVEIARLGRAVLGWKTLEPVEKAFGRLLNVESESVLEHLGDVERVALVTWHPVFFVEHCFRLLGRHEALKFLASSQRSLPVYVRLNKLKASEEEIVEALEKDGICVEKVPILRHVFRLVEAKQPLIKARSFGEGLFVVQDLASCLVVEASAPEAGAVVFDVCAAPGFKTSYLAMQMRNTGVIHAVDYSRRGLRSLKANAARLGVENVNLVLADARACLPFSGAADVVVLDPPCSESGVLARVPSLKWRLTPELVANMAEIQWRMLRSCADFVKVGGSLVYSTNSVFVEENEMQVERFLR